MQKRLSQSNLEHFDTEPRPATFTSIFPGGPPPPYRSLTSTEDGTSYSDCSTSTTNEKGRSPRSHLMIENERDNVNTYSRLPKKNFTSIDLGTQKQSANGSDYPYSQKPYGSYCPSAISSSRTSSITGHSSASEFVLMPMYSFNKSGAAAGGFAEARPKKNRMDDLRRFWSKRWAKIFCALLILLLVAAIVIPIVLTQTLKRGQETFHWLAPFQYRLGQNTPTRIKMSINNEQVRFEMNGEIPFKKSDYTTIYDFKTRKVILVDSSLKSDNKNLVCFVTTMNSTTVPSQELMEIAAKNSVNRKEQLQGWYEVWNYVPRPYSGEVANILSANISECETARWVELSYTAYNQKGQKCPECYDFCLPDYGIDDDSIRGESYLNIVKRVCFNLFVPEWRSYSFNNEQNQRDFESYYKSGIGNLGTGNGNENAIPSSRPDARSFETKWISLQHVPQKITNLTHQAVDTFQNTLMGAAQSIFGNNPNVQIPSNGANGNIGNGYPNGYARSYNTGTLYNQNGMGLNNEQVAWENGRSQGVVGLFQQQLSQNGMPVRQGPINQEPLPYSVGNKGVIGESNGYASYSSLYAPPNQNGYTDSSSGYVPNIYNIQDQSGGQQSDSTRVRQVTSTYGNGNSYPSQNPYRPVDINSPMNGVNGNGYSNQHNFGGGTNFPRQTYGTQQEQTRYMQSTSNYRPEVTEGGYFDQKQKANQNQHGSQNSGQNWMTSG